MYRPVSAVLHPIRAIQSIQGVGRCCRFRPMLPSSSGSAGSRADIKSGTCSSVSYVLRCAPPITARPATSIATLRCETLSEQVRQRLTDALTHNRPTPPAPALIRESGQETVSGFASHRLLLVYHPWPLKGKIITREREYQCERRCPESAAIT